MQEEPVLFIVVHIEEISLISSLHQRRVDWDWLPLRGQEERRSMGRKGVDERRSRRSGRCEQLGRIEDGDRVGSKGKNFKDSAEAEARSGILALEKSIRIISGGLRHLKQKMIFSALRLVC
jgi:hypothetical protein